MSTRYNTGNPIESTDVRDMSDNAKNLDLFSNSSELSFDDRLGVERKTIQGMIAEFDAQILNMGFSRIGTFTSGATLTNQRQTLLWDTANGGDGQEYGWSGAFPKVVPPSSTPASTGGISVGAWMSRFDPELRIMVRESLRRSYAEAGYTLVAGSFEAGGTQVNANDVLLYEATGVAYAYSGTLPHTIAVNETPIGNPLWVAKSTRSLRADIQVTDYAALRAYTGTMRSVYVTGTIATAKPEGVAGSFVLDSTDATTADNGGTVIVGADGRRWKREFTGALNVQWFGAKGDGVADDTVAVKKTLAETPSGGEVTAHPGTYLLSETLVLTRPVNIICGSKENTIFLFSSGGTYLAAPWKCGMIAVHTLTAIPGYVGDARRSVLSGFTLRMQAGPAAMRGLIAAAPIHVKEVDAYSFSADGIAVMAAGNASSPIKGNANGATFSNCISQGNGGSGFYVIGDDANACLFTGCRAPANTGYGFYDDSLLGNTYLGCETDGNTTGGYFATNGKPNRSLYIGCYGEGNQAPVWNIGARCIRIGSQGDVQALSSVTGLALSSMPSGDGYLNHGLAFAENDTVANDLSGGKYFRITLNGIEFLGASGGVKWGVNQTLSANYVDITSNAAAAIRFPNIDAAGNIKVGRPYFPSGVSIGGSGRSAIVGAGTAAPTTGTYDQGAIFLNDIPAGGGFIGWVCTTAGTPGTWKTFGAITP